MVPFAVVAVLAVDGGMFGAFAAEDVSKGFSWVPFQGRDGRGL